MQTGTDLSADLSAETVLRQLDAILDELLLLRESVRMMAKSRVDVDNESTTSAPSILDIVREAPGHRLFHTAEDVTSYLREERTAWDS